MYGQISAPTPVVIPARPAPKRRTALIVVGVGFIILVMLALIALSIAVGVVAFFFPRNDAPAYFIGNDNPVAPYQFYGANQQVSPSELHDMGSLTNDNTKDAGLLWFGAIRIIGAAKDWVESVWVHNGKGTALYVESGNVEIMSGSVYVGGNIAISGDFNAPIIDELRERIHSLESAISDLTDAIHGLAGQQ